jgi:hypothetical protein
MPIGALDLHRSPLDEVWKNGADGAGFIEFAPGVMPVLSVTIQNRTALSQAWGFDLYIARNGINGCNQWIAESSFPPGTVIWHWLGSEPLANHSINLAPGETSSLEILWNRLDQQGAPVPPGLYHAVGPRLLAGRPDGWYDAVLRLD